MKPLTAQLSTAYSEVELGLTTPPTREELVEFAAESSGYQERWANRMIGKLDSGESFIRSYPFPVQAWNLGGQPVFTLGGELVTDYAIELKRIFGYDTFVMGYTNDVMSYIPSTRILREGGYEGETSQMVYGMPSIWRSDIERLILNEILKVAEQAEMIPQPVRHE
jgi:neutral ceramidase